MEYIQEKFNSMQGATNLEQNERIKELQEIGHKIYHLGFGQSPFPVPLFAQESLNTHAGEAEYLPVKGLLETRETICKYHARVDGYSHLTPDNVIIGPGSKDLIFLLLNVLKGDVFLAAPTWTTYKPQAYIAGRNCHLLETRAEDNWKLTSALLEEKCIGCKSGSVLIFCNPDNPTGASYTELELKSLADVIKKTKLLVLCDEIYARLKYDGDHHSLITYLPEQCILSTGISKWASCGGWRLGYQAYPPHLRPILNAIQVVASNSYTCCSAPIQYAANRLLKFDDMALAYTRHCARILSTIGNLCVKMLSEAGVLVVPPEAGYYIFPDFEPFRSRFKLKGITSGEEMCDAMLKEAKVALLAGGPAFLHARNRLTVRLCFVNFDGTKALEESRRITLKETLPADFAQNYCQDTIEAIKAIVNWLEKLPTA